VRTRWLALWRLINRCPFAWTSLRKAPDASSARNACANSVELTHSSTMRRCLSGFRSSKRICWTSRTVSVNQIGCYLGIRVVGAAMCAVQTRLDRQVASIAAIAPGEQSTIYGMTKGEVVTLTKGAVPELAPSVGVNCVLPGAIDTRMVMEASRGFFRSIPLQRIGFTAGDGEGDSVFRFRRKLVLHW
jgi:NAD(P)-dependent dehydrogenase (short-subunit alcohol dehydrogenase family)